MGGYYEEGRRHPVPALLSFLVPGLGQITKGEVMKGFMAFTFTIIGYVACIVPGVAVHFWSIFDAYNHNSIRRRALQASNPVDVRVRHGETEVHVGFSGHAPALVQAPVPAVQSVAASTGESGGLKVGGGLLAFVGIGLVIAGYLSGIAPMAIAGVTSSGFSALLIATAVRKDRELLEERKRRQRMLYEKEILQLAISQGGQLTTSEVAAHTSMTLEEAKKVLESMAYEGHVGTSVSNSGALVYEFFEIKARLHGQEFQLQPKEDREVQEQEGESEQRVESKE
jgi:hypothetical protein